MKFTNKWTWILGITSLALCSIVFVPVGIRWFHLRSKFNAYSEDLVTQNYRGAFNFTSSAFRRVTSLSDFIDQQQSFVRKYGPLKSVVRVNTHVEAEDWPDDWQGEVDARLRYGSGDLLLSYSFVLDGDEWRMSGYSTMPIGDSGPANKKH